MPNFKGFLGIYFGPKNEKFRKIMKHVKNKILFPIKSIFHIFRKKIPKHPGGSKTLKKGVFPHHAPRTPYGHLIFPEKSQVKREVKGTLMH